MPLYSYRCKTCGSERDAVNRIDDRRTNAPECHGRMDIKLAAVSGYMQRDCNYKCPVTGQAVRSTRQRKYIMESNDLRDANDYPSNKNKMQAAHQRDLQLAATLKIPEKDKKGIDAMLEKLNPLPN